MKRSDLICENGVINYKEKEKNVHNFTLHRTKCTEINIDEESSYLIGKPVGRYVTIFCDEGNFSECFKEILSSFIIKGSVLVVGLGNERICSDSLGTEAIKYIPATSHLSHISSFKKLDLRSVSVVSAGITGKTGIESSEHISCIADMINADFVIAIDSLACSGADRLCQTIQITDTGISPGSGVGNNRKKLDYSSVNRKVVAIGVPTVMDFNRGKEKLMVTPRNIDCIVNDFAQIIGTGISSVLNPGLTLEELNSLLIF